MLKIKRDSNIYLYDEVLDLQQLGDPNSVILGFLNLPVELEDGINLSELTNAFSGFKKFISDYFAEEYEVARAFSIATKLDKKCSSISFFKNFVTEFDLASLQDSVDNEDDEGENEFVYIITGVDFSFSEDDEQGFYNIGDLPIIVNNKLSYLGEDFSFNKKVKFTLSDILSCLFEDMIELVKSGRNIKA